MTISATTQGIKPGVCTSTNRPSAPFDGQVIYMTDVDQTAVWDGTQWTVLAPIAGGRNRIINGGFDIWQRGTTGFGTGVYNADRWYGAVNAGAGSFAQSTATPLVSGSRFFVRGTASTASTNLFVYTALERADVVRLRSKVVVLSAYVRGTYTGNISISATYSTSTDALVSQSTAVASLSTTAVTTSFQRVSVSFTVPSDAVGLRLGVGTTATPMANTQTIDIWGVQLEEGAVATPFEFEDYGTTLAKCHRYYYRTGTGDGNAAYRTIGNAFAYSTTAIQGNIYFPTRMRIAPTAIEAYGSIRILDYISTFTIYVVSLDASRTNTDNGTFTCTTAGLTAFRPYDIEANNSSIAALAWSAEL